MTGAGTTAARGTSLWTTVAVVFNVFLVAGRNFMQLPKILVEYAYGANVDQFTVMN